MGNFAIVVDKLTKNFDGITAVNNVSFKVKKGEIFGFLGPNGAGKTTTINMLSTLLNPSSGKATVNNYDIYTKKDEVRRSIGIVFQEPALDEKLTGRENLEFHAMLYGLDKEDRTKRIKEVLKLVDLYDRQNSIVETYSGGMKRRLEIARGLIHKPKVLFLDEPTLGLDSQTRRYIWDYIKDMNKKEHISIILTTHYMDEADFLCDRIGIIDNGKIVIIGKSDNLKNLLKGDVITLEIKGDNSEFIKTCNKFKWVKKVTAYNGSINLTVKNGETKIPQIIDIANKCSLKILSVNLRKPSLEDVFLHFTGKTIRDKELSASEQLHEHMKRKRMMHHG